MTEESRGNAALLALGADTLSAERNRRVARQRDREALTMLFHIKQTHAPQDCPYGKGGSKSLFDGASKDVKIIGYWLAFPQHTTYLVVETDDIKHLQTFLRPGAKVTTCEITPVSDQPAPLPG